MKCMVIMPFREEFDEVFKTIRTTTHDLIFDMQIDCYWLKDVQHSGFITDDIVEGIGGSSLCISDLTGNNPNVMWETGYSMALGKPTILIGQNIDTIPFDLRVHRLLRYDRSNLSEFQPRLGEAIKQTLSKYDLKSQYKSNKILHGASPILAVTGSMDANREKVNNRIETLLTPYLPLNAFWYCGSYGIVDEEAIRFLLKNKQKIIVTGYHKYDLSPAIKKLIENKEIPFIDSSIEPVPRSLTGPSSRDIFFCMKADLIFVFWDGTSKGSWEIIDYYQVNAKNTLIGYI